MFGNLVGTGPAPIQLTITNFDMVFRQVPAVVMGRAVEYVWVSKKDNQGVRPNGPQPSPLTPNKGPCVLQRCVYRNKITKESAQTVHNHPI